MPLPFVYSLHDEWDPTIHVLIQRAADLTNMYDGLELGAVIRGIEWLCEFVWADLTCASRCC